MRSLSSLYPSFKSLDRHHKEPEKTPAIENMFGLFQTVSIADNPPKENPAIAFMKKKIDPASDMN